MGNLKLNDLEVPQAAPNLISQANARESAIIPQEEVKFENLGMNIQPTEEEKGKKVNLGESGIIGVHKSKYHDQYRRLFLISFFVILVSGFASIMLRLYGRYIYFAAQAVPDTNYQTYIDTYKKGQQFLDKTLKLSNYEQYTSFSLE